VSRWTGEITLRGEVLPIGGLKEKVARRAPRWHRDGADFPSDNEKDLAEIPKNIKDKLNIVPVKWIDEVFELALQTDSAAAAQRSRSDRHKETPASDGGESNEANSAATEAAR